MQLNVDPRVLLGSVLAVVISLYFFGSRPAPEDTLFHWLLLGLVAVNIGIALHYLTQRSGQYVLAASNAMMAAWAFIGFASDTIPVDSQLHHTLSHFALAAIILAAVFAFAGRPSRYLK